MRRKRRIIRAIAGWSRWPGCCRTWTDWAMWRMCSTVSSGINRRSIIRLIIICGCTERRAFFTFFATTAVAIFALLAYHLHLLCDLIGSRGPDASDIWPIFYLAPLRLHSTWLRTHSVWSWKYQWPLFGWQNGVISVALFVWAMAMTLRRGDSIIGVFSRRADALFVGTLWRWRESWRARFEKRS